MLRIFAPLRVNYGLVSTSLIITTSAISTSIIAINYDLSSVLKQLLQPVINKIQSAIQYLGLREGLLKLKDQIEQAFQSLKTLNLLEGLTILFEKLKDWVNYLCEQLPEWLQWEKFVTFLDWLYVVIKSIIDIVNEIEWKKLFSLFFTKEFWELTDSLGWIVSKTGGLKNWGSEDFKELLDSTMKSKSDEEMKKEVQKLVERAKQVRQEMEKSEKNNSNSQSSDAQKANEAKQKLKKEPPFIKELVTKLLKIVVTGISGNTEQEKNQDNITTIATGVNKISWSLIDRLKDLLLAQEGAED